MARPFRDLTVIIPTLNEAANMGPLTEKLVRLYRGARILVVDDNSSDGTPEIVRRLSRKFSGVRLLSRKGKARGLTSSIIDGLQAAQTEFVVVMDGDGQHPPEKVRDLVILLRHGCKVAVACRRSVASEWPVHRRLISHGAQNLGKLRLLASRSASSSDLLSGFFGLRRKFALEVHARNKERFVADGYKFLFDFLKCAPRGTSICETSYVFGMRTKGTSKIGTRQCAAFVKSLIS
ncbi:Undecaprenyl-phosphate 4-deoxy-4-formamido-L-arabinose transferase [Candidatus Burarchaeum australiense]|nr:Undecaprenyl-phosphate 4-deoxy-4-formamido-L-arabinose transferase [Candidatus Burarchaeum australiense]